MKTLLEKIESVQAAIEEVLTSQSLSTQNGTVERARLDFLVKYEEQLIQKYETEKAWAQGGFQNLVSFKRRAR